jgi:ribonuclease M5
MEKPYIKETIVVEGKDDVAAVKRAVDCEFIITHGFGISEATFKRIENASVTNGVIIFTDPDYAGEQIRARISKRIPGCKHAFLSKAEAYDDGDIGIENALPEAIIDALSRVRTEMEKPEQQFTQADLWRAGLMGMDSAAHKRTVVGRILGIGYCSSKQFLSRLNHYGVTPAEFHKAVERAGNSENSKND